MNRRVLWIGASAIVLLALIATYFILVARNRDPDAHHQALGAATVCGTPASASALTKYQIVPGKTTASYTVEENDITDNIPHHIVVGKTQHVTGTVLAHAGTPPQVGGINITVDLSSLQTDMALRDHDVGQALETDTYPNATFVSTCAPQLPASYSDGQNISFQLAGNLTMHGVTNEETFTVTGMLTGNTIAGSATATLYMTDFKVTPPNIAGIVAVRNKVVVTLDFTAQAG
jgi:polyisoprenoid-binding protein YceI